MSLPRAARTSIPTSRVLAAAGSLALVSAFVLVGASGASAAQGRSLPTGETMYAVDCDSNIGQLGSVDTTTAVVTAIGSGTGNSHRGCAGQAALDQSSGTLYWPAWATTSLDGISALFQTDLTTGVSTYVGQLTHASATVGIVGALMMGRDSTLYALYYEQSGSNWVYSLGQVDTSSGAISPITALKLNGNPYTTPASPNNTTGNVKRLWSAAFNPADGSFYVIINTNANNNSTLYTVNVADGTLTSLGLNGDNDTWFGMAFDSNGTMWGVGDGDVKSATVSGWTSAGSEQRSTNGTTLNSVSWYSESNVIKWVAAPSPSPTPSPTGSSDAAAASSSSLAATGASLAPFVVGGSLLLIGVAAVASRRLRRQ